MAEPINIALNVLDPPILEQTDFGPDMDRWLTDVVDIINASFTTLSQALSYIMAVGQATITGGSGAGPYTVSVTGVQTGYYVTASIVSTTNSNITISSIVAGSGNFGITFSADPGTSAIIAYQVYIAQPQ